MGENFYVRNDKTRAYYFTEDEVKDIFCNFDSDGPGFQVIECENHLRVVENRKD